MDVLLYQADDGGDIRVTNGIVELSPGLEVMAYLCLFGGNEQDDGRKDNPAQYWGNLGEIEPVKQYRSETQYLLRALPAISGNLKRLEDAANRDLSAMIESGAASAISASVSLIGRNRVSFSIEITADGESSQLQFIENWKASA